MKRNYENIPHAISLGYDCNNEGNIYGIRCANRKLKKSKDGYLSFSIGINRKVVSISVHRFVAYKKYGELLLDEDCEVRHLDGNKSNNSYENLVLGTHKENMMDIPETYRIERAKHAASFLKEYDHRAIYESHINGMSYKNIMKKYGIPSKGTVSYIIKKMNGGMV